MARFIGVLIDDVWRLAEATARSKDGVIPYSLNGVAGVATRGRWFDMTGYAKDEAGRTEMIAQKNINVLIRIASSRTVAKKIKAKFVEQPVAVVQERPLSEEDALDNFLDEDTCNCQVCKAMRGENEQMRERIVQLYGGIDDENPLLG